MLANSSNAGNLKIINSKVQICVQLNGRWRYQELSQVSANSFKKYRSKISENAFNLIQMFNESKTDIEITGAPASSSGTIINNIWRDEADQRKEGEETKVYSCNGFWLYCITRLKGNGPHPRPKEYQWWIGTTENMAERKGWGFFRNNWATISDICGVRSWKCWDRGEGKWFNIPNIKILLLSKEVKIAREVAKQIQKKTNDLDGIMELAHTQISWAQDRMERHKSITCELFNKITKKERLILIDKYHDVFKEGDLCSCCFRNAPSLKCIHQDCCGACETCRGDNVDKTCCACGKEQILECPICLEDRPPSFMKIFKVCKHSICWHCYAMSFEAKKAIVKCPKCRQRI